MESGQSLDRMEESHDEHDEGDERIEDIDGEVLADLDDGARNENGGAIDVR